MNALIREWKDFCEQKAHFDKHHFYTLFWEDIAREDLQVVFEHFPNAVELRALTEDYLFGTGKHPDFYDPQLEEILKHLAVQDIRQKLMVCALARDNKSGSAIDVSTVTFVKDHDLVVRHQSLEPHSGFMSEVEYQLSARWLLRDEKTYALYNAFYGVAKDYQIAWYLFKPLIDVDVRMDYYFDFTRLGGAYALSDNGVLVARNPRYDKL